MAQSAVLRYVRTVSRAVLAADGQWRVPLSWVRSRKRSGLTAEATMSYQTEREQFIYRVTREGLDLQAIHALLRYATTIQRLAELACSSEAADRDRIPCPAYNGGPCLCDEPNEPHTDQRTAPRI